VKPSVAASEAVTDVVAAPGSEAADVLASDGSISFLDRPVAAASQDELFVEGTYSDYGVTLKTTSADAPPASPSYDVHGNSGEAQSSTHAPEVGDGQDSAQTGKADDALHTVAASTLADATAALADLRLDTHDTLL
jgi:hypothetical protein